jgi:TPR repeat protein
MVKKGTTHIPTTDEEMQTMFFDTFPDWCYKIAETGKCSFAKIEKHCHKMIRETKELDTVKLFLVWFLRAYTDIDEQEASDRVDQMSFQERCDLTGVSDYKPPTKAQIAKCNRNIKKTGEALANMSNEEIESAAMQGDAATQCAIGTILFQNINFNYYIREPGDNGYDCMGLQYDKTQWKLAQTLLHISAEQGEAMGQMNLATCYLQIAVLLDDVIDRNVFFYDHAYSYEEVAIKCEEDADIFVYCAQALKWLRKAAEQGFTNAIEELEKYKKNKGFDLGHGIIKLCKI